MTTSRVRLAVVLSTSLVLTLVALGVAGTARSTNGCFLAVGHLYVSNIDPTANRMIGKINGDYTYTFDGFLPSANNPRVLYLEGRSVVRTNKGDIRFTENSAAANGFELLTNNATLMSIDGGTGMWAGATGFLALHGYFHLSTQTGEFDYRGEVCLAR